MTEEENKKSFADRFAKKDKPIEKISTPEKNTLENNASEDSDSENNVSGEKKNFMDHLIKSRTDLCFQVMGKDSTGRNAWYFILVDKDKKESFLKHEPGDSYDLADYGKIVSSGYGDEVPEDVKQMLGEKYGFDNF